jgi:lipid A 3-O-deacylase
MPESRTVDVQPDTSFFGLSVGLYNPLTHSGRTSTAFNAEWQPGVKILGTLQPLFGAMATTRGALLGYAGVGIPINVTDHVFLMPSLSIGGYKSGGDYDLTRHIVERPGVELAYQFDDKSRLGLSFDVLTNGMSFQARDRTEMVSLTYTMPLNALAGGSDATPAPSYEAPAAAAPAPVAPQAAPATPPATLKPLPHELP